MIGERVRKTLFTEMDTRYSPATMREYDLTGRWMMIGSVLIVPFAPLAAVLPHHVANVVLPALLIPLVGAWFEHRKHRKRFQRLATAEDDAASGAQGFA